MPVSISQVLEEAVRCLRAAAGSKGLALIWNVAPDVPDRLFADPLRLRQVLLNLMGNAVKFTGRGEVRVDVSLDGEQDGALALRFAVSDTGPGIPREKQGLIFKAFCQADSSTSRKHGGTGLGLTISSRLVAMMGGRIWVESEVGCGSTFYFTARFRPEPAEPPARKTERLSLNASRAGERPLVPVHR